MAEEEGGTKLATVKIAMSDAARLARALLLQEEAALERAPAE